MWLLNKDPDTQGTNLTSNQTNDEANASSPVTPPQAVCKPSLSGIHGKARRDTEGKKVKPSVSLPAIEQAVSLVDEGEIIPGEATPWKAVFYVAGDQSSGGYQPMKLFYNRGVAFRRFPPYGSTFVASVRN